MTAAAPCRHRGRPGPSAHGASRVPRHARLVSLEIDHVTKRFGDDRRPRRAGLRGRPRRGLRIPRRQRRGQDDHDADLPRDPRTPTPARSAGTAARRRTLPRRTWGYLPEERGLYPRMGVLDQLVYFGSLYGDPPDRARREALAWLDALPHPGLRRPAGRGAVEGQPAEGPVHRRGPARPRGAADGRALHRARSGQPRPAARGVHRAARPRAGRSSSRPTRWKRPRPCANRWRSSTAGGSWRAAARATSSGPAARRTVRLGVDGESGAGLAGRARPASRPSGPTPGRRARAAARREPRAVLAAARGAGRAREPLRARRAEPRGDVHRACRAPGRRRHHAGVRVAPAHPSGTSPDGAPRPAPAERRDRRPPRVPRPGPQPAVLRVSTIILMGLALVVALAPIGIRYLDRQTVTRIAVVDRRRRPGAAGHRRVADSLLNIVPQGVDAGDLEAAVRSSSARPTPSRPPRRCRERRRSAGS